MKIGLAMTVGPLCVIPSAILTGNYAGKHGHAKPLLVGGLVGCWFENELRKIVETFFPVLEVVPVFIHVPDVRNIFLL